LADRERLAWSKVSLVCCSLDSMVTFEADSRTAVPATSVWAVFFVTRIWKAPTRLASGELPVDPWRLFSTSVWGVTEGPPLIFALNDEMKFLRNWVTAGPATSGLLRRSESPGSSPPTVLDSNEY
jgi:hypothetical protein